MQISMIVNAIRPTESTKKRSEMPPVESSYAVDTLVLAGARKSGDALAEAHKVPSKAHIKVAGKSMISHVLRALTQSDVQGRVTVIGLDQHEDLKISEAWPDVMLAPGAEGPAASVYACVDRAQEAGPILVTTCDHALLTPAMINTFVAESVAVQADLMVALAPRTEIEARYPNVARTYLRFGDGHYSSCNLFCLATPAAQRVVRFWQDAEKDRKRPWRIAWRFGFIAALRILVGRPSLQQVFTIVSRRLGVTIHPVVLPFAEAAIDVDTAADLALVERIMSERAA